MPGATYDRNYSKEPLPLANSTFSSPNSNTIGVSWTCTGSEVQLCTCINFVGEERAKSKLCKLNLGSYLCIDVTLPYRTPAAFRWTSYSKRFSVRSSRFLPRIFEKFVILRYLLE